MKRILLLMLSGIALLTSCKKEPGFTGVTTGDYTFKSVINKPSRATADVFEVNDEISVSSFTDNLFSAPVSENVKYTFDGTKFLSTTPIEFAIGTEYSFRAVYPFGAGAAEEFSFAVKADQTAHEDFTTSDLMVAETPLTDVEEPTLTFNHRMSLVTVTISDTNVSLTNAEVTINAKTTADCDLVAGTFVGTGSPVEVVAGDNGTNSYKAIVAPQDVAAGTQFITITANGEEYPVILGEDLSLVSGKQYNYTGTITAEGEFVFTSDINGWGDGGDIVGGGGDGGGTTDPDPDPDPNTFTATISVSNITATSADVNWTVSDQDQEYVYGLFSNEGLDTMTDDEIMAAVINTFGADIDDNIYAGNAGGNFNPLDPETEFVMLIFAIDDTHAASTSPLYKEVFTTEEAPAADSDAYTAWLGTWNLTSASSEVSGDPITVEIIIQQDVADASYNIYGVDISANRWLAALPATFDANTNGWTALGENFITTIEDQGDLYYNANAYLPAPYDAYYFITGAYDAFIATIDADGQGGDIVGGSGEISDGTEFTVSTMCLALVDGEDIYTFYTDDALGLDQSEALVGPFTLSKVSDDTTLPSAVYGTQPRSLAGASHKVNSLNSTKANFHANTLR